MQLAPDQRHRGRGLKSIHRATAKWTALCAASSLLAALGCGGSEATGPSTGNVLIRASTTGPGLDPDGYVVAVDGGAGQSLPVNGAVTFNQLSVGSHQFVLSGVATNCTLLSPNPATVAVTAGDTAQTTFQLSCGAPLRPIAFSSNRDYSTSIYAMNADGSGVVQLTNNPPDYRLRDGDPAWSPDGTRIAFWTTRDGDWEVWVMNADGRSGSPIHKIMRASDDGAPVWSPDGTKIGFQAGGDIYVMNADGSNPVNVTNTPDWNDDIVWSPDSRTIAFQTSSSSGFVEIWVVNTDGSSLKPIASGGTSNSGSPAWRPR